MNISNEANYLFGNLECTKKLEKNVVPTYLENKYKLIGSIEELRERDCDLYEISGLIKCLSSHDDEEVRELALRTICEKASDNELIRVSLVISSFDEDENVLTTMLEKANEFDLNFSKELAKIFLDHEDISVSEYANGISNL
jgi:hypothetical protein